VLLSKKFGGVVLGLSINHDGAGQRWSMDCVMSHDLSKPFSPTTFRGRESCTATVDKSEY
jgi:hypothetical protein